jgi:hypothetical protein
VINKAFIISSALDSRFFPEHLIDKYSFWHSGYIPQQFIVDKSKEKMFVYYGLTPIDTLLIKKIAKKYPDYIFKIIGRFKDNIHLQNVVFTGYLAHSQLCILIASASVCIIPIKNNFVKKLTQTSLTAKFFVAMDAGIPIVVKKYGLVQKDDADKKIYVYTNHKQALSQIEKIVSKIESGDILFDVSPACKEFLNKQSVETKTAELHQFFQHIFSRLPKCV